MDMEKKEEQKSEEDSSSNDSFDEVIKKEIIYLIIITYQLYAHLDRNYYGIRFSLCPLEHALLDLLQTLHGC